jgi:hypothetical protein
MGLGTTTPLPITSAGMGVCYVPGWSLKKERRKESQRGRRRVEVGKEKERRQKISEEKKNERNNETENKRMKIKERKGMRE